MDRPSMDRPRERRGTPFTRELVRLGKAGALIAAVVLIVGSLPVVFLWLWSEEPAPPGASSLYSVEEVTIDGAGVRLAGRLKVPTTPGPHPAVVFVHGSGRVTRDHLDARTRDFVINGYATLTYDKRGVGESGGDYGGVGPGNSERLLGLLADDALAAVGHLRAHPEIDAEAIGLLGISQGGWIAPLAASRSDHVAFLVILSGPAVSVGEEIYYSELTGEREGIDGDPSDAELSRLLAGYDGPRGYDPAAVLGELDVPSLWILGREDRSIPIPETVARLRGLRDSGRPYTVEVIPGAGHSLRAGFGEDPEIFPRIFAWLVGEIGIPG